MGKLRRAYSGPLVHQLERLFVQGTTVGSTEGELLERFVTGRDEAAFEALVARHGPMVLGVCRQSLHDPNDVDDAFQATFLVLVRKAKTLSRRDLLGNWLYGVAVRVAARARALSARRLSRVASGLGSVDLLSDGECTQRGVVHETALSEQSPWLHQEVSRLPEKYRTPIVLCYFEGLTHEEAASRLGWPLGTVKGRLSRARDLLRRRLTRRGVTLSAAALASQLAVSEAKAAVSSSLQLTTLRAAHSLAISGGIPLAAATTISLPVSALMQGVLQTMIASQLKTVALTSLLVAGTVATGVVVGATRLTGGPDERGQTAQVVQSQKPEVKKVRGRAGPQAGSPSTNAASQAWFRLFETPKALNLFANLLAELRYPVIADIDRLRQWSSMTLQADLVLGRDEADRVAAYEAHRDRMKELHVLTQKIPPTFVNQPVMADHARTSLQEAESMLEGLRPVGTMAGMMRAMSGAGGGGGMMGRMMPMGRAAVAPAHDVEKAKAAPDQPAKKSVAGAGGQNTTNAMMGRMGGGMGGMGGGMGGMMGQMSPDAINRSARLMIAAAAAEMAAHESNPQSKAILKKLDEAISMSFAGPTPLEDILKYIKQASTTNSYAGIPIYVDPKGLNDAEATLASRVTLDLEGIPLKTSLRLGLKQIGLAYCVRDGLLIISSVQGINEELQEAQSEQNAIEPRLGGFGGGGAFGGNSGGMR